MGTSWGCSRGFGRVNILTYLNQQGRIFENIVNFVLRFFPRPLSFSWPRTGPWRSTRARIGWNEPPGGLKPRAAGERGQIDWPEHFQSFQDHHPKMVMRQKSFWKWFLSSWENLSEVHWSINRWIFKCYYLIAGGWMVGWVTPVCLEKTGTTKIWWAQNVLICSLLLNI